MALDLLFQNEAGGGAGADQYVEAVFPDVTLMPDSNAGLTDTALTNPTQAKVGNSNSPAFQKKTLLIKDVVLIEDRTKWIGQKPTYQILFHGELPQVFAYAFGAFSIENVINPAGTVLTRQVYLKVAQIGDGVGLTGKARRVSWILMGDTAAAASAMRNTDGVATTNISFSGLAASSDADYNAKYAAYAHQAANETNDLHDYQLTAEQQNTLKVVGMEIYYENTGSNLDVFPGRTFVNKQLVETTNGATFAIPSFGSSLGGVIAFSASALGPSTPIQGISNVISPAIGLSGTNLIDVSPGFGASFQVGMGFYVAQGTSMFVGTIRQVSTDTLTVFPTLAFGISHILYQSWAAQATLPISQTLMVQTHAITANNSRGLTGPMLDPKGRFAVWGANLGVSIAPTGVTCFVFNGASGFLQIDGYFQGAEIFIRGNGQRFHATLSVNGLPTWGENVGVTGVFRRTLMTDGLNGWNSVVIGVGASMGAIGIEKINLWARTAPVGVSYGLLGLMRVNTPPVERASLNASLMMLGLERRVYADQLMLQGAWDRGITLSAAGGVLYYGVSTNAALSFQFFGKNVGLVGSFAAGSTLTIDGVGFPLNGKMASLSVNGFHALRLTCGVTSIIQAVDFAAPYDEVQNTQNFQGYPKGIEATLPTVTRFTSTGTWIAPPGVKQIMVMGSGGGGGGGGGSNAGGGGAGGNSGVFGTYPLSVVPGRSYSITVGAGGAGGASDNGAGFVGTAGGDTIITDSVTGTVVLAFKGGEGGGGADGAGAGGAQVVPKYSNQGGGGHGNSSGGTNGTAAVSPGIYIAASNPAPGGGNNNYSGPGGSGIGAGGSAAIVAANGNAGVLFGGGGSGAGGSSASPVGGAGAAGVLDIYY